MLALYFIIKWAVKNGIKRSLWGYYRKVTTEDIEAEQICNERGKIVNKERCICYARYTRG
ncbi:MAG: DUF6019 family protein [Coprococcus phoceensis]